MVQCAVPRANRVLRTAPPTWSAKYAKDHDDQVWTAACTAVGGLPDVSDEELPSWRGHASLPMRLGGLGLRSTARTAEAAYWAPRANHVLRTVPPTWSAKYAKDHDDQVWTAACAAVGGLPDVSDEELPSLRGHAS